MRVLQNLERLEAYCIHLNKLDHTKKNFGFLSRLGGLTAHELTSDLNQFDGCLGPNLISILQGLFALVFHQIKV